MCSLFGWLDYKSMIPTPILKKLTQALANAAEERGDDDGKDEDACQDADAFFHDARILHSNFLQSLSSALFAQMSDS